MTRLLNFTISFLGVALSIVGIGIFFWQSNFKLSAAAEIKTIDAHVHLGFDGEVDKSGGFKRTAEEFLAQAKKAGIVGFVAHYNGPSDTPSQVEGMKGASCVGVREKFDAKAIDKVLEAKKFNCIKIYLGYVHRYAYDKLYEPVYQVASKRKVPVVFHTGDTYTENGKVKYADPLTIDEVAVDHRDVTFVIAHSGNPWFASAAEVAYKNSNVYLDVAALMIGDLTQSSDETKKLLVLDPIRWVHHYVENSDKMMFGTDWPLVDMAQYKNLMKKAIPVENHEKFFYKNAAKVFNL